jgi:hypothetical protein
MGGPDAATTPTRSPGLMGRGINMRFRSAELLRDFMSPIVNCIANDALLSELKPPLPSLSRQGRGFSHPPPLTGGVRGG